MNDNTVFSCTNLHDTQHAGLAIAGQLTLPACVYLHGDLGAGKTTLCQSIIQGFGYQGLVTSPTYNLIQEYSVEQGTIYHMDLYRLNEPAELEFLALEDLWAQDSLFLIEWPSKGEAWLRSATHEINIVERTHQREITVTCCLEVS